MMKLSKPALIAVACGALTLAAHSQQSSTEPAYKNPQVPLQQRVNDLVARMTLEEKVSQLGHTAEAIPRLGVPEYNWWNEGLHGVARAGYATVFPQAIGMAASFDEPLVHKVADVISTEFRAKYYATRHPDGSSDWYRGLTVWSPNINIFRDPRWGRGQETYGEDPFLTSRLGVAFITGLQGDDPRYLKVVATSKHFAVHSGPESTRHTVDVKASRHDMEDTYLPAFRATVVEGKAESVMCAYNSLNGEPACANAELLRRYLRQDWGFQGYVVSDCGAVTDIFQGHHYAASMAQGAADALKAGTDLICGVPPELRVQPERSAALQAVRQGLLPQAVLDGALRRTFTARFRLGMFDPPDMVPYARISPAENDTAAHRQLALRAARESLVLLKNRNHFLPLKKTYSTIAVIGPDADSEDALVGNYHGTPSQSVTIVAGIRRRFAQSQVLYAQGTGLVGSVMKAVPASAFYTDASRSTHGLKGEYFLGPNPQGAPVMTRTDGDVDFQWGAAGVTAKLAKNFSVRWSGVLLAPATGNYQIGFTGQDGYRVWLDNSPLIQDWTSHHPASSRSKEIFLKKGQAYPLKIEFFAGYRGATAQLRWNLPGENGHDALEAARKADLVIMVLGLSPTIEGEEMDVNLPGFEGGDRTSIDLPAVQQKLLRQVYALRKPVVLVLMNGSALAVNWADRNVPAILEAWYPGEDGGMAVAEALAGDFSPGGRLPVTFYKSLTQVPPFDDYSMARRTYRYFSGTPLYPFGYGLSYTTFTYSNAKAEPRQAPAKGTVTISADLTNSGRVAGDEVAQVYLSHPGVAGAPLRSLEGFQRVHLEPGQKTTVSFTLDGRQLSVVDAAGRRRVVPGTVRVWIGGGQRASRPGLPQTAGAATSFTLTGSATLPQ